MQFYELALQNQIQPIIFDNEKMRENEDQSRIKKCKKKFHTENQIVLYCIVNMSINPEIYSIRSISLNLFNTIIYVLSIEMSREIFKNMSPV